jgi:HK97 gp10 family phage protein
VAGRLELSVHNAQAIVTNLYGADRVLKREAKRIVNRMADDLFAEVQRTVAYDTGFMHDHLLKIVSEAGLTFEVGWDASDFIANGKAFYPFFVEYGTSRMAAQPSLEPAYRKYTPRFRSELNNALRGAIARINMSTSVVSASRSRGLSFA